ncbi:MAG: SdpI family protein [Peptococcaceae bacterium]|jgi:uncharacterized membrane protein|nr:SdpI family protein [Peptococcaceae bacterium]MDH7526384.1 SdpI family protein [Peptococcaceae bacterium]
MNDGLSKNIKKDWPILLLILATLAAGICVYPRLPDMIPGHWNIKGQVDGWVSKSFGVLFFPLLNLGLYPLMLLLPRIDPRRENYRRFAGAYRVIRLFLHAFLALIYIVTLLAALGYALRVDAIVKFFVSLLILVLGNYMGKIKHNYFVGIKTPWTLASEEVWYKTHRFAAPLWVGAGALGMVLSVFRQLWLNYLYFASFIIIGFVPIIYSYFLFRKTRMN